MPVNAEPTANGHSSMTFSSLALAAVLIDSSTGAGGNSESLGIESLQRATRDDYDRWLNTALAAGGCVRPVRLRGTVRDVDTTTGEILHGLDTEDLPDKAMYVPCGDRRASVCPPCAETYRADTYQLIRAGLAGSKGMPESLAAHPCVFATFTALPSARSTPASSPATEPLPGADHGVRPATARTGGACRAGSGTRRPMPAWAARCARTATTTQRPSCGTPTRRSCGGAPSSASAAAWTSSPRLTTRA
jgi:hypothetical protein